MLKFLLITVLSLNVWSSTEKPKYGPQAIPLSISHTYFQKSSSPHFWSLIPYYIPQKYGWSCSVASVAMLVNALRVGQKLGANETLVSEDDLINRSHFSAWDKNLKKTAQGIDLDELKLGIEASLKSFQIQPAKVEVIHVKNESVETQEKLHQALVDSEKENGPYILSNFLQGTYTGDAPVGHFAPVGAYDAEKKKVLILDPDRQYYEPYWVSEKTFLIGMKTKDKRSGNYRGYVLISLPAHQ